MKKITGYLVDSNKIGCTGCESCSNVCPKGAICMKTDSEGFRYPIIDTSLCISCGLCHKVCPIEQSLPKNVAAQEVYGGYVKDEAIRAQSTSGGAFSAIVKAWIIGKEDYVIFGAVSYGLIVKHSYIKDITLLSEFRKSKYSQSIIGNSYRQVKEFLQQDIPVLFSGTPCQIGGLINYLKVCRTATELLLTVEVVCEGVPSPLYLQKLNDYLLHKYGGEISSIDYRYKDNYKWDFQVMKCELTNGIKPTDHKTHLFKKKSITWKRDRWFNPFWSIWLNHLMSRPSCYRCPYVSVERVADITLGDLWGVHLYCPELYGNNGGASVIFANSPKGIGTLQWAKSLMYGHNLKLEDAVRYQAPMCNPISMNPDRSRFMADLEDTSVSYETIIKKWHKPIGLKMFIRKYIWGNKQKVVLWQLKQTINKK